MGYNIVLVWECKNPELSNESYPREFVPYPHYIVYDFETVLRKRNTAQTSDLRIDCSHIPVSIAINDTLTKEPVFIENQDPEQLTRRQEIMSKKVWDKYPMIDESILPKQV